MICPNCSAENIENARFCAKCGTLLPVHEEAEHDALIGQTVGGRYRILRMLGEGGMGRVYEAERAIAGVTQRIAIKTLHPHLSKDQQVVARFNRECATVAQLNHPNTIKIQDFGQTDDGTLYIAMEFVDGTSIAKEIETKGAMPPERVERIIEQVCGALAEAHKQGIVHRDLKPENVVLMNVGEDTDVVKVLDFGIAARKESTDAKREQKLTQQGMVLGTPPYMSPEQFMGKELDLRSDIYSLGVMTYEMLTGKLPFDANTPWEWATKHMTAQPFPFEDMPTTSDIPGKMKDAIFRALAKNPAERQDSAKAFFEELRTGGDGARLSMVSRPNATAAMAAHEAAASRSGTQLGMPLQDFSAPSMPGPGVPSMTGPGIPPVPVGPAVVPLPPPPTGGGASGGPNKGVIYGLMGAAGLLVLAAGGMLVSRMGKKNDDTGLHLDPTATPPATVSALPPATVSGIPSVVASASAAPIDTSRPTPPSGGAGAGTAAPTASARPSAASGPEACNEAKRLANSNVPAAVAAYNRCDGPQKASTKNTIAGAVPGAVRSAVFRGDCRGARNIAAAGSQVGRSVDVDKQYPECKGK
jgi:serine/threonine-protein kinase